MPTKFNTEDGLSPLNLYPDCCGKNCGVCKETKKLDLEREVEEMKTPAPFGYINKAFSPPRRASALA